MKNAPLENISILVDDAVVKQIGEDVFILFILVDWLHLVLNFSMKMHDFILHTVREFLLLRPLFNYLLFGTPVISLLCVQHQRWASIYSYKGKNNTKEFLLEIDLDCEIAFSRSSLTLMVNPLLLSILNCLFSITFWTKRWSLSELSEFAKGE